MSQVQTIEQKRAAEAWDCVSEVKVNEKYDIKFKKEYRSMALKLPSYILTNGLGQTLAFLKSKVKGDDDTPETKIYKDLQDWLLKADVINWRGTTKTELIEKILAISSGKYRLVTTETLAFLNWLKRFADAVLPKDGG